MNPRFFLAAAALLCLSCVAPTVGSFPPAASPTPTAPVASPSAFDPNHIPEAARSMITSIHTGVRSANEMTATRTMSKDAESARKTLVSKGLDPSIVDTEAKAFIFLEEPSKGHPDFRLKLDSLVLNGTTADLALTLVDTSVDGFFTPLEASPWMFINLSSDVATMLNVSVK